MKKNCLILTAVVFLVICINGIQAQTTKSTLNQVELMKQFIGTWNGVIGKDTVEVWETKPYGEALIINVSRIIKGTKSDWSMNNIGFDEREGKYKGYILSINGGYDTWIGWFTADKKFHVDLVDTFDPEKLWFTVEFEFKSPANFISTGFNTDGVKTSEFQYKRIK